MTDDAAPRRRESDDRIDRIEGKVDRILEKLEDPEASALGRILSDRANRNERRLEAHDMRIDGLEGDRDKVAGAMGLVRWVQVILAIAVAALALYVALRQGAG